MKRNLLLLPLLVCFQVLTAQDIWPAPDAEWCINVDFHFYDIIHVKVDGQEMVDGVDCTRLLYQIYASPVPGVLLETTQLYHIYFNGDTVFWRSNGDFFPLVCFNLEVGDGWYPMATEIPPADTFCNFLPVTITGKTTVEYNGESYRQVTVSSTDSNYVHFGNTFDERIFSKVPLFPEYSVCDPGTITDYAFYSFNGYEDSNLSLGNGVQACLDFLSVDEVNALGELRVYPNPVLSGESITVSHEFPMDEIQILSLDGKVLQTYRRPQQTLEIDLRAGVYFLRSVDLNGQFFMNRLVVE